MKTAIIFDCEFVTLADSPRRFWCGPQDPDPVVVQIGAVKLGLEADFPILDGINLLIKPKDRHGNDYEINPFFTSFTGITKEAIADKGEDLGKALQALDEFAENANFWSWGKDEFNMMAISCYVANIAPPFPATRFDNACKLLLAAGMPPEDLNKTRSNGLAAYYGLNDEELRAHDALDDARSIAFVLQHLLKIGDLDARAFKGSAN